MVLLRSSLATTAVTVALAALGANAASDEGPKGKDVLPGGYLFEFHEGEVRSRLA